MGYRTTAKQQSSRSADDDWELKATRSAIAAAKEVISSSGGINPRAAISTLSDIEWGWIAAAAIFAWIKTKSEQAVSEGCGYEIPIRTMTACDLQPWEAGAVSSILPALGNIENLDWSKPIGEWSKDQIVSFAWSIYKLTHAALAARDEGANDKIVRRLSGPEMEREASASVGGPLLASRELNDAIPF